MGASNTIFAGGSLLAVTVLMGASAHAMEPAQAAVRGTVARFRCRLSSTAIACRT